MVRKATESKHFDDYVSLKKYKNLSVGHTKDVSTKKKGFKFGYEGGENNLREQVYSWEYKIVLPSKWY